jgi:hypothetical protein
MNPVAKEPPESLSASQMEETQEEAPLVGELAVKPAANRRYLPQSLIRRPARMIENATALVLFKIDNTEPQPLPMILVIEAEDVFQIPWTFHEKDCSAHSANVLYHDYDLVACGPVCSFFSYRMLLNYPLGTVDFTFRFIELLDEFDDILARTNALCARSSLERKFVGVKNMDKQPVDEITLTAGVILDRSPEMAQRLSVV